MNTPRNDKRARLVEAANILFHQQGINITTLANIATLANVPLGNVYYYFKSKDSLVLAVIALKQKKWEHLFQQLNTIPSADRRLISLLDFLNSQGEHTAQFGDDLGSLCQEIGKQGNEIATAASGLMQFVINWAKNQFVSLGYQDEIAGKVATNFIATLQGMSLMTLAFKQPEFLAKQKDLIAKTFNLNVNAA